MMNQDILSSSLMPAVGRQTQSQEPWVSPSPEGSAPKHFGNAPQTMRKRHSFFGRSHSDAAGKASMPTLHSTMSSQSTQLPPARPGTMHSDTRRRKTEPLEHIRNSIFGGRKKNSPPNSQDGSSSLVSRPSSRTDTFTTTDSAPAREPYRTDQEYYRNLRKLTISPPFHFEHVTHTEQDNLPPLDTVDEKDLPARFWAVSAYQRPKRHLNGIRAQNLSEKLPAMGIERGAPSSRPTSPSLPELPTDRPCYPGSAGIASGIDETMFDEVLETSFDPAIAYPNRTVKQAKRESSLGALNEQRLRFLREAPQLTFYESNSSSESDAASEQPKRPSPNALEPRKQLDSVQEEPERTKTQRSLTHIDRARQPLPPLPGRAGSKGASRNSLLPSNPRSASISSITASDRPSSTKSRRSSRSTQKSPAVSNLSSTSDASHPSLLSDATWEEDVDFCYQQEAESTCNFDWQGPIPTRASSIAESDGGVRLSAWIAPSPLSSSDSRRDSRQDASSNSPNMGLSRELSTQHQRGLSVGHRGFLAARRGSTELNAKKHLAPPSALEYAPDSTHVSILSPVFSVVDTDENPKTPMTPKTMHFRGFDGVQRLSVEYPSDLESNSTGSKHSKSSSYGSYESAARATPAATREPARWSVASSSSVPDLLHSKRRSKASLHKSVISRPLVSLPQSPTKAGESVAEEESTIVPRASQIEPMRNTFVMRRPQTSGERESLQAAGKTVQRCRSQTPNRFSRLLAVEEGRQLAATVEPGWI